MNFASPGEQVVYLGINGYAHQRRNAEQYGIKPGDRLTVTRLTVSQWSSVYQFDGVEGNWNTVMFAAVETPVQHPVKA